MSVNKLDPSRTMQLRGFNGRGAAMSLHDATASGFTLSGVFCDAQDFGVMEWWTADDFFGHHPDTKYLPDFDFTGLKLDFDVAFNNVVGWTSAKYGAIDWSFLDVVTSAGVSQKLPLILAATSGNGAAPAYCDFEVTNWSSMGPSDTMYMTYLGYNIPVVDPWGSNLNPETWLPYYLNWQSYPQNIPALQAGIDWRVGNPLYGLCGQVLATGSGTRQFRIYCGSYGYCNVGTLVSGSSSTVVCSNRSFLGLNPGSIIFINGTQCSVLTTNGNTITVNHDFGSITNGYYVHPGGGADGNTIELGFTCTNSAVSIHKIGASPSGTTYNSGNLSGGIYPNLHVHIDFANATILTNNNNNSWEGNITTGVNVHDVASAFITISPQLNGGGGPNGGALGPYAREEFSVVFSGWTVTDPSNVRPVKYADQTKLTRVGSMDPWTTYSNDGYGWGSIIPGNFYHGYCRGSSFLGDMTHGPASVSIFYSSQYTHDLWLGTQLQSNCGIVNVVLDGTSLAPLDCYSNGSTITKRKVATSVAAGQHTVVFTLSGTKNAASSDYAFYFDYIDTVVATTIANSPSVVYSTASAASDWDTDHSYRLSPSRLIWMQQMLGFSGDWNHYVGVFWWNQRKKVGGTPHQVSMTFTGSILGGVLSPSTGNFTVQDYFTMNLGGTTINVDAVQGDTVQSIVLRFRAYINALFGSIWADVDPAHPATLLITTASPLYTVSITAVNQRRSGATSAISFTGDLGYGTEGIYVVDTSVTPNINLAARKWHADFFSLLHAAGTPCVASFSQELLNPPEGQLGGQVWAQRFYSGNQVLTATGFGTEGVCLILDATNATPIVVHAPANGYIFGNTVNVSGVQGNTATNGTWAITIIDADHFSLNGSVGNGTFVAYDPNGTNASIPLCSRNLQTIQCAFSSPVTNYMKEVHLEMAQLMQTAGLTPWTQFGEVMHWFFSETVLQIVNVNLSTFEITTSAAHGLSTGDTVIVAGTRGTKNLNGTWIITVTSATTFTLNGCHATGTWIGGGQINSGSMAYYDSDQTSAAALALSRPLALFTCQDSDPSLNSHQDADFLANRVYQFCDTIRLYVLATVPSAHFEILWPFDVNFDICYHTPDVPYPQGGRMNYYVNLPSQFMNQSSAPFDRFKVECLSWGATYRNFDNARRAMNFATQTLTWPAASVRYLIPIFNGGCDWTMERAYALVSRQSMINFWAFDHICLLSWTTQPLPAWNSSVTS